MGIPIAGFESIFVAVGAQEFQGLRDILPIRLHSLNRRVFLDAEVRQKLGEATFERQGCQSQWWSNNSNPRGRLAVAPGRLVARSFRQDCGIEPVERDFGIGRLIP